MTWKFSTGPSDDRAGAAPPTMNGGARDDRKGRPYAQRCGNGHPGRGGHTIFTVGNAVPGVPQNAPNQPPPPANPHHLPITTVIAKPKAVAISCEIVQILTMYQEIATSLRSSQ